MRHSKACPRWNLEAARLSHSPQLLCRRVGAGQCLGEIKANVYRKNIQLMEGLRVIRLDSMVRHRHQFKAFPLITKLWR